MIILWESWNKKGEKKRLQQLQKYNSYKVNGNNKKENGVEKLRITSI